jgi:hypothetical protein
MYKRFSLFLSFAVAFALVRGFCCSQAAEIKAIPQTNFPWGGWSSQDEARQCDFSLEGDIEPGDLEKLKLLHGSPNSKDCTFPRILLNSPVGGNFEEGVALAEYFLHHGISTAVASGSTCHSACALAFMGGTQFDQDYGPFSSRHLHVNGRLSFHAPYHPGAGVAVSREIAEKAWQAGISAVRKMVALGSTRSRAKRSISQVIPPPLLQRFLGAGPDEKVEIETIKDAVEASVELYGLPNVSGLSLRMMCYACENISGNYQSECRSQNLNEISQSVDGIEITARTEPIGSRQCKISLKPGYPHSYRFVIEYGEEAEEGLLEDFYYFPPEARLTDLPTDLDRDAKIRLDRDHNPTLGAIAPPSSPSRPLQPSLWNHNGSTMRLIAERTSRRFVYESPRPGIAELGIAAGVAAFEGGRNGNRYSGTAYVFSKKCGRAAYRVEGTVSSDEKTVLLRGRAPVRGANCRVSGYREDNLVFELIEATPN